MHKCPFCGSSVEFINEKYFCSFCDMNVTISNLKNAYFFRGAVDWVDAAKTTKELMYYHTFDLLLLLRFCRQERRNSYNLMSFIGRFKNTSPEVKESYDEGFRQYDYWTKKVRIAENLVKSRIGSIPKAVSNQLLERYYLVFQEENQEDSQLYA